MIVGKGIKNTLLLLGSTFLALLVAETLLRVFGFSCYWTVYRVPDPDLGWKPLANVEAKQTLEGKAVINTNSLGFRGGDFSVRKGNELRIAVLGDSFTESAQIPESGTWWSVLRDELEYCVHTSGRKLHVQNFGVSGYSTAQELLTLRKYVWMYDPDVVILNVFTANDIVDNHRGLSGDTLRPYFVHNGQAWTLDSRFRESLQYRFADSWPGALFWNHLVRLRVAHAAYFLVAKIASSLYTPQTSDPRSQEPWVDMRIYAAPEDPEWQEAWETTEWLLGQINEEVQQHGKQLIVLTASNPYQVLPDPVFRQTFAKNIGVDDLFYPDRRIRALGHSAGFPVIMLAPILQAFATDEKVVVHGFENTTAGLGHWNQIGHNVVGSVVASHLCAMLGKNQ